MVVYPSPFYAIPLCCIFFLAGCSSETAPPLVTPLPPVDAQQSDDATATGTQGSSQVSTDEAEQFARQWEQAIRTGDATNGAGLIDFDAIVSRTLEPLDLDEKARRSLATGLKASSPMATMIRQLGQNEQDGGSYRVIGVALRGGQQHATFRLIGADSSLNYHDLRIVRGEDGLVADQFFVAISGEDFSDTLRATIAPAVKAQQSSVAKITGAEKRQMDELQKQQKLMLEARSGDHRKALQIYEQLSSESKKIKTVQIGRLMAAMNLPSDEYLKVIDEYEKRFPNDPSLPMVLIDAAVMREDAEQLEEAHTALNAWTGGDPYLDLMVAGVLANFGQVSRAQEMIEEIDVDAVGVANAHDFALNVALMGKDHEMALAQLRKLRDDYGYQFGDLRIAEGFEDFVNSSSFQEWQSEEQ